ncbi:MAG: hypothetical protein AAF318_08610 [Pseudomonadota bacterium]
MKTAIILALALSSASVGASALPFQAGAPAAEGVTLTHGGKWGERRGRRGRGMRAILRQADGNGDRELTQDEVDAFIAQKVSTGDANGDGNLTLEEFQAVWAELSRRRMVRAFQRLDTDGDASLTTAELDERFGNIVERLDRNDDGVLSRADRRRGRGDRRHRRGE